MTHAQAAAQRIFRFCHMKIKQKRLYCAAGTRCRSLALLSRQQLQCICYLKDCYLQNSRTDDAGCVTCCSANRKCIEQAMQARSRTRHHGKGEAVAPYTGTVKKRNPFLYRSIIYDQAGFKIISRIHYNIIVDAADNFETRLIVNDAAVKEGIPFLYGACIGIPIQAP